MIVKVKDDVNDFKCNECCCHPIHVTCEEFERNLEIDNDEEFNCRNGYHYEEEKK